MIHKIVVVYQSLLGIYGDQGNAQVLTKRLQWRGIDAELVVVEPGQEVPTDGLIYLLGGGEDRAQSAAVAELKADGGIFRALDAGGILFAVCAGYQICGKTYTVGGRDEIKKGLGLLDVETRRGPQRAVGEILTSWQAPDGASHLITGFENHAGYTSLGSDAKPVAKVEIGIGNGDGFDGAQQGRVIGVYPHGPILPRNPRFADYLLEKALGHELPALDHPVTAEHKMLRERRIHVVKTTKDRAKQTR